MNIDILIKLINEISNSASQLIARLIASSGVPAEELRARRDQLSADTHRVIDEELAKLG